VTYSKLITQFAGGIDYNTDEGLIRTRVETVL